MMHIFEFSKIFIFESVILMLFWENQHIRLQKYAQGRVIDYDCLLSRSYRQNFSALMEK